MYPVPFHIRDAPTDAAVRRLARLERMTLTETVREAAEREHALISEAPSLIERLRPIQSDFASLKRPGGRPADKAFFDDLSGEA
jgi:hypothetical protein